MGKSIMLTTMFVTHDNLYSAHTSVHTLHTFPVMYQLSVWFSFSFWVDGYICDMDIGYVLCV